MHAFTSRGFDSVSWAFLFKVSIGNGIGNTIMNIGSSFVLIPIVNTFMKQNSYNFSFVRITSVS